MTMVIFELRSEAALEASRLASVRALTARKDDGAAAQLEGGRPWLAVRCGRKARQVLGRRLVLVWRVALENGTGATVESHLVAVVCEVAGERRARRRHSIDQIVRGIEPRIHAEIGGAVAQWLEAAERSTRAFTSAHVGRRRAVADQHASVEREFQAGLFDRRSDRAHDQIAQQAAAFAAEAAERLTASLRWETISKRPPQLLLALAT